MSNKNSEVARIRQQISDELEAMQHGFKGFMIGTARHDFIHARMRSVGEHQERLAEVVGQSDAVCIACELYMSVVK